MNLKEECSKLSFCIRKKMGNANEDYQCVHKIDHCLCEEFNKGV